MALQIERVLDTFFEFTLDGGSPIIDTAPSLTFIEGECHFKTKNGANITKEQKIAVDDVTVVDTFGGSGSFNYANILQLISKLEELNFFQDRVTTSVVGATRFDNLQDTFSYIGQNGKIPVINESQQKLVPTEFNNISLLTQLQDVAISSLIENKFLQVKSVDGDLKIVLADVSTTPATSIKRIEITADGGETEFIVDNNPSEIWLFKNGVWQIQTSDFNYAAGVITPLHDVVANDYFEIIPLTSDVKKIIVSATSDNQTEYNYDGNPAFADVYLNGSRLREGLDFTRTTQSANNKIVIINQSLIDIIKIGDIIEILTY